MTVTVEGSLKDNGGAVATDGSEVPILQVDICQEAHCFPLEILTAVDHFGKEAELVCGIDFVNTGAVGL